MDSKILISQAFGIINSSFAREMHLVRSVRNVFAHSILEVSFDTEEIRTELNKSELAASFFSMMAASSHEDKLIEKILKSRYENASGKDRYIFLVRCGCSVLGF